MEILKGESTPISKLTDKIIDILLIIGACAGSVSYGISLLSYSQAHMKTNYYIDAVVILCLILASIFKNKVSTKTKSYVMLSAILIFFITDIIKQGIYSDNKILIVIIPFFVYIVFSLRKAIQIFAISIIIFMVIGYLHVNGYLINKDNALLLNTSYNIWIVNLIAIVVITAAIIIITHGYISKLFELLNNLKEKNRTIEINERNYREIFNSTTDAIFIHELSGKVVDVNNAMLQMYGFSKDEVINSTPDMFSSGESPYSSVEARKFITTAAQGTPIVFDWNAKNKSGSLFWVEVSLKKVTIGKNERIIAACRDINDKKESELQLKKYKDQLEKMVHERTLQLKEANLKLSDSNTELEETINSLKKAQNSLIHSEKMSSLGIMAAGVAHEVNNPLNFISGGIFAIESLLSDNNIIEEKEYKKYVDVIYEGIKRANVIVSSLNHFSRDTESLNEKCHIHSIINNCLTITNNKWKDNISINKDYKAESDLLQGNDGKLHQAFLNIITNSIQAIPDKGEINIITTSENNSIQIVIKDNGTGIKPEFITKISDPFFTTKDPGVGTGLGLSITYNIIKEHKGEIEFESDINKGTTVTISLPHSV